MRRFTVTIPARELAPGMIPTHTIDEDGRVTGSIVWVPADALKQSTELRHPPLPELRPLFERFATLCPSQHGTAEEWEIDFRNDWNYDFVVLLWAHAADVFERLTAGRALCDEKNGRPLELAALRRPGRAALLTAETIGLEVRGATIFPVKSTPLRLDQ